MRITRPVDGAGRPRRRLNVGRIKLVIVGVGAAIAAILSMLSGITPQAAFAPMLSWMLGFAPDKSQATAIRVTAVTTLACVAGVVFDHSVKSVIFPVPAMFRVVTPAAMVDARFVGIVMLLFVSATLGALFASKLAPRRDHYVLRRAFLFTGVCIGIYVAAEAAHFGSPANVHEAWLHTPTEYFVLGLVVGALTRILGLASGILIVPALYFMAGEKPQEAVLISLTLIGLAALLPAWTYTRKKLGDANYAAVGMGVGIACGFSGGTMLAGVPSRLILMMFALMAMFYCAREISVLVSEATSPPPGPDLT